ncbi:DUF3887 domain-containing protein [Peptoniphilus sp. AGMB00490]|uniref:DUF3887 domain-containing protein n=1 Tax=Peptoniphilus faecalis TaxID=2731255 RepID=A0A848RHQ4_9FIRM|nr:DUF3887 domain-containing protein [Peptoniphilus faecalis]NMW84959.1 DUF3887 domain-containing protein [Peptoniphilus faecalis]
MRNFKNLILIVIALFLVGCGSKGEKMSDDDFSKYEKQAQAAISLINERKTVEFIDLTEKSLGFKKEILEEAYKNLENYGKFVEFGKSKGIYEEDKDKGETYFTILQKVKYDKKDALFRVSFNKDNKIIGIFFK